MEFITGFNRDQLVMMDFESCVGQDSWARTVDMFVDILQMEELGFRDVLNSEGRPPYRRRICSSYISTGTRTDFAPHAKWNTPARSTLR